MDKKIMEVLRKMQEFMDEAQLRQLQNAMDMVFCNCDIVQNTELIILDDSWLCDLDDFLMSKSLSGKSIETIKRYRYELNRLLSYVNKAVANITASDISSYMRLYKKCKKISNITLKNVRAVYSSFFSWLIGSERIVKDPMKKVDEIKAEYRIQAPFTNEEMEKLLRNCETIRDKAIMEFLYSTAVRVSELSSINIEDIRFASKDLIVLGKGAKERVVYMNDKSNMYLMEYLDSRNDNNKSLFVGLKKPHSRLTKSGIEDIIRRIGKKSGVDKSYPHKFRRTAITNVVNRGMPLQEAMIMAGHAKPETTMRYCTVDQESVRYHHKKCLSA